MELPRFPGGTRRIGICVTEMVTEWFVSNL